jgi:hypothetical protein
MKRTIERTKPVACDYPVTSYVDAATAAAIMDFATEKGCSVSLAVRGLLVAALALRKAQQSAKTE